MHDDFDPGEIDRISAALEADDPRTALALATDALARLGTPDPLLHFYAGRALLDLDEPEPAIAHLERSVRLDPDDPDYRLDLVEGLVRMVRLDIATEHLERLRASHPELPEPLVLAALVAELGGDLAGSDALLGKAARLDPERFPSPRRMTREAFEEVVRTAGDRLPETFRSRLEEVVVTVESVPSLDILREEEPPLPPELLGLFVGPSLAERSSFETPSLPSRILLFQRNLERIATDRDDLEEQIAITLYHELGHYLGLDEDEIAAIDLA